MTIEEFWFCEECGAGYQGEPAHTETYPTHEGQTVLYFCDGCTL